MRSWVGGRTWLSRGGGRRGGPRSVPATAALEVERRAWVAAADGRVEGALPAEPGDRGRCLVDALIGLDHAGPPAGAQPGTPAGRTPGRSAGGTLGSTGRGRRMPTLAAYLAELHDQGRAPASASSAVAAARFRARRAGEPSPAGGTHRSESSPATGGPPATAAEGRRGRAGRRTSPPSSPPATGPRRRRAGVESDKSPSRRPVPGSPQHRQPSRPASGLAHAFVFPCPVTGQGPDHSPPVCFQSAGARNVDQSINAPCRAGEPPRPRVAAPRALPGRRLFSAGPTPPRRRPPAGTREPAT